MSIIHPCFMRKVGDKVVFMTIITNKAAGMPEADDSFVIAQTSNNIYTNNRPAVQVKSGIIPSTQFIDDVNKAQGSCLEHTRGMSINGILRAGFWSIHETQSIEDLMGG